MQEKFTKCNSSLAFGEIRANWQKGINFKPEAACSNLVDGVFFKRIKRSETFLMLICLIWTCYVELIWQWRRFSANTEHHRMRKELRSVNTFIDK